MSATVKPVLDLGQLAATSSVHAWAFESRPGRTEWVADCIRRHTLGDWGDLDPEDVHANDRALIHGARVLSSYPVPASLDGYTGDNRLWIITEADRSSTTLLWPSEY